MIYKVYSRWTVIISRVISFFISPYYKLFNLFRSNYRITDIEIKTILVTEYHRIGDVLIISPVLKSLKRKFPKAHLILICNKKKYHYIKKNFQRKNTTFIKIKNHKFGPLQSIYLARKDLKKIIKKDKYF